MCRLYGFRATEPTKVECTLVHAQNALMVQSRRDRAGLSHGHGWGVATYEDHTARIERQAWAAFHGEHFQRAAARVHSRSVLAHIRRATVGPPALENTHPFTWNQWAFAHNGTIPRFKQLRPRILDAIAPKRRQLIRGQTDSEHVFHFLLTLRECAPELPLVEVVRRGVKQVVSWCKEMNTDGKVALNLMLTDGEQLAGSRLGRTLFRVERQAIHDCEICGFPHVHHTPGQEYRAVVVASEPISPEAWEEVPECSVYFISPDMRLQIEPLGIS
ncbi:MAG: class II glutamine amidotransferase [Burkholderiales bacterium]|nr:class II glutamine amidotransferase [Burkholderiales bacterium]